MDASLRIVDAHACGTRIFCGIGSSPSLSGLNVAQIEVQEIKSAPNMISSLGIDVVDSAKELEIVSSVAATGRETSFCRTLVGSVDAGKIVQTSREFGSMGTVTYLPSWG